MLWVIGAAVGDQRARGGMGGGISPGVITLNSEMKGLTTQPRIRTLKETVVEPSVANRREGHSSIFSVINWGSGQGENCKGRLG